MAWTANDMAVIAITATVCLGALTSVVCWNIRRSRCTNLRLCGFTCDRKLMSKSELSQDTRQTMNMMSQLYNNQMLTNPNNQHSNTPSVYPQDSGDDDTTPPPSVTTPRLPPTTSAGGVSSNTTKNKLNRTRSNPTGLMNMMMSAV